MAQLSETFVLVCDDADEFARAVAQLDAYQANPENASLDSRADEPAFNRITYTKSMTVILS